MEWNEMKWKRRYARKAREDRGGGGAAVGWLSSLLLCVCVEPFKRAWIIAWWKIQFTESDCVVCAVSSRQEASSLLSSLSLWSFRLWMSVLARPLRLDPTLEIGGVSSPLFLFVIPLKPPPSLDFSPPPPPLSYYYSASFQINPKRVIRFSSLSLSVGCKIAN